MPPPQANEDQHKSPPDMSHKTAPKQILQRKQISQQEYDLRKEWAPETVSDYQVQLQPKPKQGEWQFHDFEKSQLQPQPQRHQHAATVAVPSANANANTNANNKVPGRVPNRRSALFEEWKAKSLRSPEQVKEARAVQKDNCTGNRRINTSGDVRLALGERFDKAGSGPARNKPRNNSRSQQAGSIDTKSNAVSGGARKPLVEHTAEASNLPKTESASKVPTQLPELNSTQDITASGNTEKALKEPSNGTADTGMKAEAAKTGPIQQPETQANVKAQTETKSAEKDSTQQPEAQVQENSPPKSTVESLGGSSKVADTQTKIEPANRDLSQNPEKNNTEDKITRDVGQTLPGESGASLAEFSGETSDSQTKTKSENDGCMPQTAVTKVEDAAMSKGTSRHKRTNPKRAVVAQAKVLPSNSGSKQQPEDNKAGSVTEEAHPRGPSSEATNVPTNVPIVKPRASTSRKSNRRGRPSNIQLEEPERHHSRERQASQAEQPSHARQSSRGRPGSHEHQATHSTNLRQPSKERQDSHARHPSQSRQVTAERQQHFRERSREQVAYTAPKGTQLTAEELRRSSTGNILAGKDKVYFMPCFIEDPWSGLIPVPATRPRDLMMRF